MTRSLVVAYLVLLIFSTVPALAQQGWAPCQSNTRNTLLAVECVSRSPGEFVAVGSNFTIRRSSDGGKTWLEGFDPFYQFDVTFTDTGANAVAIAVGAQGRIIRSQDGGRSWSTRASPTVRRLHDVDFPAPSVGYAVGELGTVIKSIDGGLTWLSGGVVSPFDLYGVSFTDSSTGTVVGANGSIWQTTSGGAGWLAVNSGTPLTLRSVDYLPGYPEVVLAVGDSGILLRSTNGGRAWVRDSLLQEDNSRIVLATATDGAIVGSHGTVLLTHDGGDSWAPQATGVAVPLYGAAVVPDDIGNITVVGGDGVILQTTNGGAAWMQRTSYSVNVLRGVAATRTNVLTVGAGNVQRRSSNGGTSWSIVSSGYPLRDVCMVPGTRELWAVGDQSSALRSVLFHSNDGGINWAANVLLSAESFSAVRFIDSQHGFLGSSSLGRVYRTTDGGNSWANTSTPPPMVRVFGLAFSSPDSGHAIGASGVDGRISFTTNSGSNWSGQAPAGIPFLYAVGFCCDPDVRTVVGDSGVILHTTDRGLTWVRRTGGTDRQLEGVSYASESNVYAVGDGGTILHSTDGSQTWSQQTSGTTDRLHDVAFAGRDTGVIVGNGGIILTTTSGGVLSVGEPDAEDRMPNQISLSQNYPNPFNPVTSFEFRVSSFGFVSLKVYDVLGREVATLVDEMKQPGEYTVRWDAGNQPSGVYFCRLEAIGNGQRLVTRKLGLIK